MVKLGMRGILSFSTKPLQLGIFVGIGFSALAFILAFIFTVTYFIDQTVPSGWTTMVVALSLFSGVQLIVLGILGTYIGGIYEEVRSRPRYIIEERIPPNG